MENYRITIDSNSDLPSFLAEKYQTVIIPQYYAFGDEVYGDEKNMTPAEFYQKMREGALPSSMANNPAVIRERFEGILKEGFDILHIAFSSALSGSYNNVCVAAQELMEEYPDRKIVVVDSLNVSLAETILFLKAHQLQEEGRSLSENAAFLTLEVRESNAPAIALYQSFGFTERGQRKRFYSDPEEDALIYTLDFINTDKKEKS